MRCLRCGICCKETEMLLSEKDIKQLEKKGYIREFFVRFDNEGYAILRNQGGYCVFYNKKNGKCKVRSSRPLGCRIYPVIYDETKGVTIDTICPNRTTMTKKQKAKRGQKVIKLLKIIDDEAEQRHQSRLKMKDKTSTYYSK